MAKNNAAPASANRWVIALTVLTGTIMAVLDSSIVNVALPSMSGNLGVTVEEITWVVTGYILSQVIVMPITGMLSQRFGRKRLYQFSVALFTVTSMLCGLARTLPIMVLFRVLQGFGGGVIMTASQAILRETFPPEEQAIAMGLYGLGVVVAPALGPTLGGWLTDQYSWPWIFYVNVPIGVLNVFLVHQFIKDPPYLVRDKGRIDWGGLAQAQAEFEAAQAGAGGVGLAGAQAQAARAKAAAARADIAQAEANEQQARADVERIRPLAEQQIVSRQQFETAQANARAAAAKLDAARENAAAAEAQSSAAQANIGGAQSRVDAARAMVEQARLQLAYTHIAAPASGIVAKKSVQVGQLVSPGQALLTVVPLENVWVTANLKETQLSGVNPGDPAEIKVDAYPGLVFHGQVESLSPSTGAQFSLLPPENATGNFTKMVQRVPVRIRLSGNNPRAELRPGMSSKATIEKRP